MACSCSSSTVIRSCPPYANANDVNDLLSAICPDCTTTVAPGTDSSLFCAEFGGAMDECCDMLVVFEGSNVWFSLDCALWIKVSTSNWDVGDVKQSAKRTDTANTWLRLDGRTVGNATSGGTARANVDMQTLFYHLWAEFTNTELIIETSLGVPTIRGASAAADWTASKRMPIPDLRGRVIAGEDDPTGADPAGVVTDAEADLLGGTMGEEDHTLTEAELAAHSHVEQRNIAGSGTSNVGLAGDTFNITPTIFGVSTADTGGDSAHNTMQPTYFLNHFMYTGN